MTAVFKNKNGSLFALLGYGTDAESKKDIAIYRNIKTNKVWTREKESFEGLLEDGITKRFIAIDESMTLDEAKDLFKSVTLA